MPALEGRTALITGSTQGLGLVAAERFASAGFHVVITGLAGAVDPPVICRGLEERYGVRSIYVPADLRRADDAARLVDAAVAALGAVDVLVNNAVVRHAAPIDRFPPEAWDEAVAVNLSAAFHTIRGALPIMRARGWGRIVNVSSIYGVRGAANRAAYVATKTGLIGLTRAVALETAGEDITCNAVCPGTTRTPVHEEALARLAGDRGLTPEDAERALLAGKQPTGRLIAPERVADLMVYLCSPAAADITGAVLPIDGAWSAA